MSQHFWQRSCTLLSLALCACGASASFRDNVYDDGIVRYRIGQLGPSWNRIEVADNDLAFHDRDSGTISVNSTCTEYEDVPNVALLNQLLFGTAQRVYRLDETVTLDGRGAQHAIVDAELDGVPVSLTIYLLRKDGCVYDLTQVCSRAACERGRPLFDAFAHSFAVLVTRKP
jgi:hypothetical protein